MIRNVVLAIVLLVQLVIWFVVGDPFGDKKQVSESVKENKLSDIDLDGLAQIEIRDTSGRTLAIDRRDGRWVIPELTGYPAIENKVTAALDSIEALSGSEWRSRNKALHEDYQVDDKAGRHVMLKHADGTEIAHVVVGKRDFRGAQGTFIRMSDSDDVYVKRGKAIASNFSTEAATWVSRSIMGLDLQDANGITDLRNECYKLEVEGRARKKDKDGKYLNPVEWTHVRYVYEKVERDGKEPIWRVVEPEGMGELEIWDQQIKGMIGALVGLRWNDVIGTAVKPEYKLDEGETEARAVAWFNDGDRQFSYRLDIGAEHEFPEVPGRPRRSSDRYAKVAHPNDSALHRFVVTVHNTFTTFFVREPATMVQHVAPSRDKQAPDGK